MTTFVGAPYSTPGSDSAWANANMQTWATAVKAALDGCGLVQTADTGQMNPATVAWPGTTDTDAGYFVYRFNDSRQATDPIFVKIFLGRGQTPVGVTRIRITVGQGSDGAGNITGTNVTIICADSAAASTASATDQTEYATHSEGHAALISRYGSVENQSYGHMFSISRTRDLAAAFDGGGLFILHATGSVLNQMTSVRFASPATVYTDHNEFCVVPNEPADTALLNGDKRLYPHFSNFPDIRQAWATFTFRYNEIGSLPTSFSATPYGATSRTFLNLGNAGQGPRPAHVRGASVTSFIPAILWE